MNFSIMELLMLALASFRLTRLIVNDKITEFIRAPFFDEFEEKNAEGETETYITPKKGGIRGFFGELLSCYWCTGIWSSIFLFGLYVLYPLVATPIILVMAVAGLAAIIETIVQRLSNE